MNVKILSHITVFIFSICLFIYLPINILLSNILSFILCNFFAWWVVVLALAFHAALFKFSIINNLKSIVENLKKAVAVCHYLEFLLI